MTNEERLLHALYGIKKVLNDFGLEDIKNEVQFKDGNSETIDCISVLQEFVVDYVNSKQPYKFEDLKPYMFVFDKHFNGWGEVLRVVETSVNEYGEKIVKCLATGDSSLQTRSYKENRFFPATKAMQYQNNK